MTKKYYLYKVFRVIFLPLFKFVFRPKIINEQYIPKNGAAIIAGNHKHALDPILVDVCTKRIVFTLAKKNLHDGIFGFFFRAVGTIPVDLNSATNKAASDAATEKLKEGNLINLSPEAKRNYTEELLLPFKYGAVSMAKKTNSIIVPYSITGSYKMFSKNLKIVFGKPIDVSKLDMEKANEKLFNAIKKLLEENMDKNELETKVISKYSGIVSVKKS
ncbi:MAG: 1-acyl-sn-glycerol-3-phosphate acyltransferase [Clostridia bacterium]|nr:1-acyl-sn-glycerol-3-phosphate acyltransferase [Clostridia bacterium]